jgi:hypothetical protein
MAVHSNGSGTGWQEAIDDGQPHGLDYQEFNDLRIGVRKRLAQEHNTCADNTVGGIHKPGGTSCLGIDYTDDCTAGIAADGTYRGHGLVWGYSDTSNWGALFCSTKAAGATTSGDWTILKIHPDLQWGGGDITWAGAHEFDASVDISGPLDVWGAAEFSAVDISGGLDCTGALACGSTVAIIGTLTCSSSATFTDDVTIAGDLQVDGTLVASGGVDVSGDLVVSGGIVVSGDISSPEVPWTWGYADFTTNTVHAHNNVGGVDWSTDGNICVSFAAALASANYAALATLAGPTRSNEVVSVYDQSTGGFHIHQETGGGAESNDCSEVSFLVLGV